ncbi:MULTISPECIES: response regulator [unclassified Colwellia]|jgi:two-component system response regulator CpxR|uniref:response regulator n=1 Tax=unclassified Colwellia TaxID=196834 RepID=UPI000D334E3B|nr:MULTISPECIES: response regulator [unclassified Colwellia]AWB56346.1 DNA-binding response regulator [Colwellia sp. Arc7-D]MBA6417180.1 response regulator [Colwellia sp. 6M3]|tara:strand:+ start:1466 stop:2167 length:702 start_codon:yes stop_codon:yes gene_type:complete
MNKHKLLLIDDDKELAELLTDYLATEGFDLICCHDGISGLEKAFDDKISLILLDVMMPGLTGFEVLKALGGNHKTPILMLTAKGDNASRILGLELGADDYLPKPFQHRELLARINAILRRINIVKNSKEQSSVLQVNGVKLNHATREVSCHDQFIELTGTEYQIIEHLMAKPGEIVSKIEISEQVLKRKLSAFDRSIDMHVSNIRRKLLPFSPNDKLKTIRGAGYIFLAGELI